MSRPGTIRNVIASDMHASHRMPASRKPYDRIRDIEARARAGEKFTDQPAKEEAVEIIEVLDAPRPRTDAAKLVEQLTERGPRAVAIVEATPREARSTQMAGCRYLKASGRPNERLSFRTLAGGRYELSIQTKENAA